jgi:GT2 family glycosyltransferase
LVSLSQIDYPQDKYKVLFYDNGSSDGSVAYVKDRFPWVEIIPSRINYGFTGGNNRAVKYAQGDYLVFLNNDVRVDRNWLIELVKIAIENPTVIATSKSLFMDKNDIVDHAGTKATFVGRCFSVGFGRKNDPTDSKPKYVIQPYGASMLIRKSIFDKLGQFDETYFTSLEDTDLGMRAWLYGYKVIYVPTSVFYHVGGGTGGWGSKISNTMLFHVTKNSYMNILKYFDSSHLLPSLVFAFFYDIFTSINAIRVGRIDLFKSILQAHAWVIRNIAVIFSKRNEVIENQLLPSGFLFRSGFFATLSEMMAESSVIQNFYEAYYA